MRTFAAGLVTGTLTIASIGQTACNRTHDSTGNATASESAALHGANAARDDNDDRRPDPSSPFIVGEWKFIPGDAGTPMVDTEFRFVNPTNDTVLLEYAFFEPDGTFCGCDRDTLNPNKTTIYTVQGEANTPSPNPDHPQNIPNQFSCAGTSGALKAFVFKNKGAHIFLDDTTQVGFQTHAFGGIMETPDDAGNFNFLVGNVMTEATMAGVTISDSTRDDIRVIHQQCNTVQVPLM